MMYSIVEHRHRFAAWAAGRAANVSGCRFSVQQGKRILESSGLSQVLVDPGRLPIPARVDSTHRKWRNRVIDAAHSEGPKFTHGVAAKLINIYLKAGFVCGGHSDDVRVQALHPPIDSVLLDELARQNVGGLRSTWNSARKARWSKFNSEQYESVIAGIRSALGGAPLWEIEKHWQGYQ